MRPTFTFGVPGAKDVWTYEQLEALPPKEKPKQVEVIYIKNTQTRKSLGVMQTHMALLKFG
jgi:hypothetical protein